MHCILCGDFVRRFVSLDGFQGYPRLQFRAVSLPLSGQQFSPFDTSLDTAILPYPPVHFSGTIIDIQLRTFSNKRFLMLTNDQVALDYALNVQRPKRTGVRIDCLGYDSLGGARPDLEGNLTEHNQWRLAHAFFEY